MGGIKRCDAVVTLERRMHLEVNALKERFDIIIGNFSLTAYDELNYMKVNDMPSFRDFEVLHGEINKFLAEANEEKR